MPDVDNTGAESAVDTAAVGAEGQAPAGQDQGTKTSEPVEQAKDGADSADEGDDFVDDGKDEPSVQPRKSNKDFIIKRKNEKIAKLKAQQEADAAKAPDARHSDDADDDGDDDSESFNLDGLAPIVQKHLETEDAQEVQNFLDAHPDFKPFEAKVKRWMQHPSRRNMPVSTIFFEVAGDNMLKMGAERERKAQEKAKATQAGGGTNRESVQKSKNVWDMTDEEFAAEKFKVLNGR